MVDMRAPDPATSDVGTVTGSSLNSVVTATASSDYDHQNPSVVTVTIAGCGGCGINLARALAEGKSNANVLFFDTSITNSRRGESVNVLTNGSGSGSLRSENSREIEREITGLTEADLGVADVAILTFSLAGGSGSVIGPLMAREYSRRANTRVICLVVADTSSSTAAKNTINTLKTLTAIANNASLYLPIIILSNDQDRGRRGVDEASNIILTDLVELLTQPVFEVDRNDRLNWINPAKVVSAKPGLKLMSLISDKSIKDESIVIGLGSTEMVDSTLIVQNADEDDPTNGNKLALTRLKKVGFHYTNQRPVMGTVSGDIKAVDDIIDSVERVEQVDKSQRYDQVDRLNTNGSDDLIL